MARYLPAALIALTALMLTAPVCSRAQTAAFTLNAPIFDYPPPGQTEMGYQFTVANNSVPVYGLGFYDNNTATGSTSGLNESHSVGIFSTAGGLLVQGTVSAGTVSPLVAGFRYTTQLFDAGNNPLAAPFQLIPGSYIIEALSLTDHFVYLNGSSFLGVIPDVTYAGSRYKPGAASLTISTLSNDGATGYFGGNFLNTPFPSVPEPGAVALLSGGLTVAGMTWRKRSRRTQFAA